MLYHPTNTQQKLAPLEDSKYIISRSSPHLSRRPILIASLPVTSGKYPDLLKVTRVTPLHKGGLKSELTNYRSISVLSPFNKIFETEIKSRFIKFWNNFNKLYFLPNSLAFVKIIQHLKQSPNFTNIFYTGFEVSIRNRYSLFSQFNNYFSYTHNIHSYEARNSTSKAMTLTRYSTKRNQNPIKYKGVKIWNSMPNHLKSFSFRKFKHEYKEFLLDKYR